MHLSDDDITSHIELLLSGSNVDDGDVVILLIKCIYKYCLSVGYYEWVEMWENVEQLGLVDGGSIAHRCTDK